MQTYFTELPSPSLKHKAHKYSMKKFINGAWRYFYYDVTGKGYKNEYSKSMGKSWENNSGRDRERRNAEGNANHYLRTMKTSKANLVSAGSKLALASKQVGDSYERWQAYAKNSKSKDYDMNRAAYLKGKWDKAKEYQDEAIRDYSNAHSDHTLSPGALQRTIHEANARRNYGNPDDAKAARALRNYKTKSVFGKIETSASKAKEEAKTKVNKFSKKAKQSIADAFKKAKNATKVTVDRTISSMNKAPKVIETKKGTITKKQVLSTGRNATKDEKNKMLVNMAVNAYANATKKKKKSK